MEKFFSGYCRILDESRMVQAESDGDEVFVDCAYASCPHAAVCQIGKQITAFADECKAH